MVRWSNRIKNQMIQPTPTPQGTPRSRNDWLELLHKVHNGKIGPAYVADAIERELSTAQARVSAAETALAFELTENLKLSGPKTTQYDLEMFVTKQAYRLQASAAARPDAQANSDTPPSS